MNDKYQISVIIPAYNEEEYLPDMLNCLKRQSFHSFEVIIVDDGSTDDTWDIINAFKLSVSFDVKLFRQKNSGQSVARNYAVAHAEGKYLAFVDADDTISDDYLEKLYNLAEEAKSDVALCAYKNFIDGTDAVELIRIPSEWDIHFFPERNHVFQYSTCQKIIRRSFVCKYDIEFSAGEQMEDVPYSLMLLLLADKVIYTDEIMYFHRVHENSTMSSVRRGENAPNMSYRGMETAVLKIRSYCQDSISDSILEYCTAKILTGFLTTFFCKYGRKARRTFVDYCYYIMDKYFPDVIRNPFIFGSTSGNISKLPFTHRLAVKMFAVCYKARLLYPFSALASAVLRHL